MLPVMRGAHLVARRDADCAVSSAFALINWPEVQKPHCGASCSMKACCSGSSLPFCASPSTVWIGAAVHPHRELAARVHRLAVEQHRARAALAAIAADLGAGEPQVIAQQFDQRPAIFHLEAMGGAVDRHANRGARDGAGFSSEP